MKSRKPDGVEQSSAIVSVQLFEVLAEIEALLRSGREVQRELFRVRGVPSPTTRDPRRKAAEHVQVLVAEMQSDSRALSKVVGQLRGSTNRLAKHVERDGKP